MSSTMSNTDPMTDVRPSTIGEQTHAVLDEAGSQAQNMAADIRRQVSVVTSRTKSELRGQAEDRAAQAARGLRNLSTQATALANGRTEEAGDLTSLVGRLGIETGALADRLESRGTAGLLEDMTRFGRRRPMVFLGVALGAGVLAGRALRAGAATTPSPSSSPDPAGGYPQLGGGHNSTPLENSDEVRV
jgi:ElaB/YqjD/DUF883 family membrane-anchored ribosome-binding protein